MKKQLIIGILVLLLGVSTIAIKLMFFPQLTTASSWNLDFFVIACGIIQIAIGIGLVGIYLQETKKLGNG